MQVINYNDNTNQDPIQELPNEMFTSILSFLPPSSIAHSSAASRLWRAHILSIPTLHEEIDLTKLDQDEDILPIVYHFQRLSFLSLKRLTKVSLNMNPFLTKWIQNQHHQANQRFEAYDILLTTLQQSQKTVKEITLLLDGPGWSMDSDCDILPFLFQLLRIIVGFTSLKSIWFEAPVWFSLKAGNSDGKTITVLSKTDKILDVETGWSDGIKVAEFMREVKNWSGGTLTEFSTNTSDEFEEEGCSAVIAELSDCLSLKLVDLSGLQLGNSDQELWEFTFKLRNLRALTSQFFGLEVAEVGNVEILRGPQGVVATKLESLSLTLWTVKVDWDSIGAWAGDKLESLTLRLESQSIEGLSSSAFDKGIIIKSIRTLKTLHISNEGGELIDLTQEDTQDSSRETKLVFPNLETLHLHNLQASILQRFSNAEYPRLRILRVVATDSSLPSQSFDCLIKILKRYDARIIELDISIHRIGEFILSRLCFNFDSLRKLEIGQLKDHQIAGEVKLPLWLSTSFYPSLTDLVLPDLNDQDRKEVSSKLKARGKAPNLQIDHFN